MVDIAGAHIGDTTTPEDFTTPSKEAIIGTHVSTVAGV